MIGRELVRPEDAPEHLLEALDQIDLELRAIVAGRRTTERRLGARRGLERLELLR